MEAAPREAGWSNLGGALASGEQAPYRDYEMLPERDLVFRHLGTAALVTSLNGAGVSSARWFADELPSFEAYIVAKYPHLPPEATAELVGRFHKLAREHGLDEHARLASSGSSER